jgi:mono/diheme cytochrome c family protein
LKTQVLAVYAIFLCMAVPGVAQTPDPGSALTSNPVFHKECAKCHGKAATGRHFAGPSLVGEKVASATPENLRNIIENGHGRMPKFGGKLAPADIEALVNEIQALNHR